MKNIVITPQLTFMGFRVMGGCFKNALYTSTKKTDTLYKDIHVHNGETSLASLW